MTRCLGNCPAKYVSTWDSREVSVVGCRQGLKCHPWPFGCRQHVVLSRDTWPSLVHALLPAAGAHHSQVLSEHCKTETFSYGSDVQVLQGTFCIHVSDICLQEDPPKVLASLPAQPRALGFWSIQLGEALKCAAASHRWQSPLCGLQHPLEK